VNLQIYKLGSTASLVIRLIGLLRVVLSQRVVLDVWNKVEKLVMPMRKEIRDSLIRQGMQKLRASKESTEEVAKRKGRLG